MTRNELNRIAFAWLAVVVAIIMLLSVLSSCNVLKGKRDTSLQSTGRDSTAVQTMQTNVSRDEGSGKGSTDYTRETTITPVILRDTITNMNHIYPTTFIRETGTTQTEYRYINTDSTRIDRLETMISSLVLAMSEKEKNKDARTPWYLWVGLAWLGACTVAIIYMIKVKK